MSAEHGFAPARLLDEAEPIGPEGDRPELPGFPVVDPERHDDGSKHTPFIVLKSEDPAYPVWLSPNVWVTDPQHNLVVSPKVGAPHVVWARVSNLGTMDAVNVQVRFWWANPSVAITEAAAHPIGAATGVYIPGSPGPLGTSVAVPCPATWVPVFDNAGHECLLAKAWCPGFDPAAPAPPEPGLDLGKRYSAQHNVTVVQASPGQAFQLKIAVANPTRFALDALVEVRALGFAEVAHGLHAAYLGRGPRLTDTEARLPIEVTLGAERTFHYAPSRTFAQALLDADAAAMRGHDERPRPRGSVAFRHGLRLDAWEHRALNLVGRVPSSAVPGQAYGLDITESLGDLPVGGYTAFVLVPRR